MQTHTEINNDALNYYYYGIKVIGEKFVLHVILAERTCTYRRSHTCTCTTCAKSNYHN